MKKSTKQKKSLKSIKSLHKKAWKLFSEYVRRSNADWGEDVNCYTCGKILHWKQAHAGHFKHGKLDFDICNIHIQCSGCNTFRGGKLDVYATRLVEDYGIGILKELEVAAGHEKPYTREFLLKIIKTYQEKLKQLTI